MIHPIGQEIHERMHKLVQAAPIILFMKGLWM